tara:strand:- start:312 stop:584 length:273 start_codon:yes stop_codon:yes gene_type:complete
LRSSAASRVGLFLEAVQNCQASEYKGCNEKKKKKQKTRKEQGSKIYFGEKKLKIKKLASDFVKKLTPSTQAKIKITLTISITRVSGAVMQ